MSNDNKEKKQLKDLIALLLQQYLYQSQIDKQMERILLNSTMYESPGSKQNNGKIYHQL